MADKIIRKLSYHSKGRSKSKTSSHISDSEVFSLSDKSTGKKPYKKKQKKIGSRRVGTHSGKLRTWISKASRKSKRPSTRKSHVKNAGQNNEGFRGRMSVMRSNITGNGRGFSFKFSRATSIFKSAFAGLSDNRNADDKSSTSGPRMDPETKEAYDSMKFAGQPEDLAEVIIIIDCMIKYENVQEIQHLGMILLTPIAMQEPKGLIESGILDRLLHVFSEFSSVGKLLESACVLVWNLATEVTVINLLLKSTVCDQIVVILKAAKEKTGAFSTNEERASLKQGISSSLSPSAQIVYKAVGALKVLVVDEECKAALASQGAIELMINAYFFLSGEAPKEIYAQETCIACIQNFCNGPKLEEYCEKVFKAQGPLLVMRSMLKLSAALEVQVAGCAAIWNMCLEPTKKKLFHVGGNEKFLPKTDAKESKEVVKLDLSSNSEEDEEPEVKKIEIKEVKYSSLLRRTQLAEIGAGTRALAALKQFTEDTRVVTRALGALNALVRNDENIIEKVRQKAHSRGAASADLGVINIYDVIHDVIDSFPNEDEDGAIHRFSLDLLGIFEMEDDEETNRLEIERLKLKAKQNTLKLLETSGTNKSSLRELRLPPSNVEEINIKDKSESNIEVLLKRKSFTNEFDGAPTPMVQRRDVEGLSNVSDLVRDGKIKKQTSLFQEVTSKKPSVLMTPAQKKPSSSKNADLVRKISDLANDDEDEDDSDDAFNNLDVTEDGETDSI